MNAFGKVAAVWVFAIAFASVPIIMQTLAVWHAIPVLDLCWVDNGNNRVNWGYGVLSLACIIALTATAGIVFEECSGGTGR